MQEIHSFLDSTYLKTDQKSGSEFLRLFINEAIEYDFKLVMIRPEIVSFARKLVDSHTSNTLVGTVIDFPLGQSTLKDKITEANIAIENGADELDFVINYQLFKNGELALVEEQVFKCTEFCLSNNKSIKWIIEIAALSNSEIKNICLLIKDVVITNFEKSDYDKIFIKSSTGFFKTQNNLPNGATLEGIKLMVENGSPLLIKASGGVRNLEEVEAMLELGVRRIGTSSALNIIKGKKNHTDY